MSGALLGVSFFPGFGLVAWVALVPFCVALREATPRRAYLLGLMLATPLFLITQYPLVEAMHVFGKLSVATSLSLALLLVVLLSLAVALAPWLATCLTRSAGGEFIAWFGASWAAVEFLRTELFPFGGYPWCLLAQSQADFPLVLQISDLIGGIGLSFLIVWSNQFFADMLIALRARSLEQVVPKIVLTILLVAGVVGYGICRQRDIRREIAAAPHVRVGIVQGNIAQGEKWVAARQADQLGVHQELTKQLADAGAELIIWPEAAYPYLLSSESPRIHPTASSSARPLLLLGAVTTDKEGHFYNSALLFDAAAKFYGLYHKVHLVPFGEYVPYKKLLFFAKKLVSMIGEITPGRDVKPLVYHNLALGPLICFEDIFPGISRRMVREGANLLVNLTNDAWYGRTAFPHQHHAHAVLRAVETRRYVVRATNTGVSSIIDPTGKVIVASPLFERLVQSGVVHLLSGESLYVRLGDWFAWGCVVYVFIGFVGILFPSFVRRGKGR